MTQVVPAILAGVLVDFYQTGFVPLYIAHRALGEDEDARAVVGSALALAGVLLVAAGWVFDDFRKLDRLYWLEEHRRVFSAAPTAEVRALFDGASADVKIFRMEADHIAGLSEPINSNDVRRKIEFADHLLRQNPQPITVGRRIALAILDHDEETARWHLRRLLGFIPGHAEIVTAPLRQFVEHRPGEFAALGPMLDEELVRRPKPRW